MFNKVKRYFADPYWALGCDLIKSYPRLMSDEFYIRTLWRMLMGYELDLKNPKTFNEKLQWLKLYDRNPLYTILVDKYRVKQWVADKIGEEYVIPTLAVWDNAEDIDISILPEQFVLKCNHDSGSVVICKDKKTFDLNAAKDKLGKALKHNFYLDGREWPYKNVRRCIFAEKYLNDGVNDDLIDYKFMMFNGQCKCLFTCVERQSDSGLKVNFYTPNWQLLPFTREYPNSIKNIEQPTSFKNMLDLAQKLAFHINNNFVRIDLYETNGCYYFSEFTFYPGCGFEVFQPFEWDCELGDWIRLS